MTAPEDTAVAERVRAAFGDQAGHCRALGSPFTAALCETLAGALDPGQGAVARKVLNWPGDPSSRGDSVPLRLCGALHALALTDRDPALVAAYAARRVGPKLLTQTLLREEAFVLEWLKSPPQTNEVGRSAALIGAARFLTGLHDLPLDVMELGTSAGLNLNFHRFHLLPGAGVDQGVILRPDWQGAVQGGRFTVARARGVDLRPIDPVRDGLRLMAYCWADQDERLARLRAALDIARTHPPQVVAGDAGAWLTDELRPLPGRTVMVMHTVAAQYFPPATLAACEAALAAAGRGARPDAPVAHFAMEADGGDGAALTLRLWDGGLRGWHLGRADFHGRWIRWSPRPLTAEETEALSLEKT